MRLIVSTNQIFLIYSQLLWLLVCENLKIFMFQSSFAKNHALKSSRTFVVNLFNEINSIHQSNLFNLIAIIAATGLRKLRDYWPKNFVTNCFN